MRYSAFISYSHKDRAWAGWLHRELERYRLPKALVGRDSPVGVLGRKLPPVFQDREELAASSDLAQSVREALDEAANLIVICSTNGAKSRWVNEEVRTFAGLGRARRIQYLLVPEADDPDGPPLPAPEVIPPAAFELGGEPLAADARRSGDGKRNAFLKLVAGLIGVRYDELRQREQARRQKRLLALASAASIGFVTMSGLAGFALVSRAEAVRERDIARQKTITAERTTEFVKGLFQVSDPSEAKGEEITARQVLDRGIQQIEGALATEPDVKAELVSTLAEVYIGLGSYRRADELIRRSLAIPVRNPETACAPDCRAGRSRWSCRVNMSGRSRSMTRRWRGFPRRSGCATPAFIRGRWPGGPRRWRRWTATPRRSRRWRGRCAGTCSARGGKASRSPATSRRPGGSTSSKAISMRRAVSASRRSPSAWRLRGDSTRRCRKT